MKLYDLELFLFFSLIFLLNFVRVEVLYRVKRRTKTNQDSCA